MAQSHNLGESNMEVSEDVLHVYEGRRAINDLVAKLCEAMQNPSMQEEIGGHLEDMLKDYARKLGDRDLERPLSGTPNPPPMRQEQEHERLVTMHAEEEPCLGASQMMLDKLRYQRRRLGVNLLCLR